VSKGAHCLLVCDGASWHQQGGDLIVPDNITLLPLPPYSPELNPMENVWDYLRGNKLSSLVWDSYEAMCPAPRHGGSWSTIQHVSSPSEQGSGRVLKARSVGISSGAEAQPGPRHDEVRRYSENPQRPADVNHRSVDCDRRSDRNLDQVGLQ
jgi:hypothetical protein